MWVSKPRKPENRMTSSNKIWQKKYRWVLTWPGEEKEDWTAFHDGLCIGRIQRDKTSLKKGTFMWNGNCSEWGAFFRPVPHSGRTSEAWEAAKAVEDWYDAGLQRSGARPADVEMEIRRLAHLNPPGWQG